MLAMDLEDHRDDQVDQDQNNDDPEWDEENTNARYGILDCSDVADDDEPVVHDHLLEQHHQRRWEVVKVHLVVVRCRADFWKVLFTLVCELPHADLCILVEHQVEEDKLA